ncbi:MAG TPA: hypothetical protein VL132_21190, partial [Planctomycetaceae bacterium]|nr:hypothetical protein [Planctomycetaceae bacterium]
MRPFPFLSMVVLAGSLSASGVAMAQQATLTDLQVYPPNINLTTNRDRQLIVVQATYSDGLTRDVSPQAVCTLANPALARQDGRTYYPLADGQTELKVEFEGKSLVVPVKVERAAESRPISFKLDVEPVFMKAGCNTGSCHGAARGKDGFRLSLFGYDPDGDYLRITSHSCTALNTRSRPSRRALAARNPIDSPSSAPARVRAW